MLFFQDFSLFLHDLTRLLQCIESIYYLFCWWIYCSFLFFIQSWKSIYDPPRFGFIWYNNEDNQGQTPHQIFVLMKSSWRRCHFRLCLLQKTSRCLQDMLKTYYQVKLFLLTRLRDIFNTFLRRTTKTTIYRRFIYCDYLGHTSEKFMVSSQNLQKR